MEEEEAENLRARSVCRSVMFLTLNIIIHPHFYLSNAEILEDSKGDETRSTKHET